MSPRGKVLNEKMRKETLEKIEMGALTVFADYGFYGTTMKKIAAETGLSYGLIYHYFRSKEEVFCHMVAVALTNTDQTFNSICEFEGNTLDQLNYMSEVLIKNSFTGTSSKYFQIVLQAMTQGKDIEGLKTIIMEKSEVVYKKIIPLIIEGQQAGLVLEEDPFVLAMTYLSMIQGLALFAVQGGDITAMIKPKLLTNLLLK